MHCSRPATIVWRRSTTPVTACKGCNIVSHSALNSVLSEEATTAGLC